MPEIINWNTTRLKSICQKQKLYKTFFKSGEASKIEYYKTYANMLTHLKEISKNIIFKTKSITKGKRIENGFDVAETFNNYFANVGQSLSDKIAPTNPSHSNSEFNLSESTKK